MKLLFISCTFPPDNSATANLIYKLLPYFGEDTSVDSVTVKKGFSDKNTVCNEFGHNYYANCVLSTPHPIKNLFDFSYAVKKRIFKNKSSIFKNDVVKALIKKIEKVNPNKYDAVIVICAYYEAMEAVYQYSKRFSLTAPVYLYQVDPFKGNKIYSKFNLELIEEKEKQYFDLCKKIFTTPIIYKEKSENENYVSKLVQTEFPIAINSEIKTHIPIERSNEIRCVFTGMLYGELRDATFTLKLFSKLKNKNIHIYFIGFGQEELLNFYSTGELKDRLHYLGKMNEKDCNEWINYADILINIGNSVYNQVPSKLFQYIGYCKPILNIVKDGNCPTIKYLEKYPCSYTTFDDGRNMDELSKKLEDWIITNYKTKIDYNEILDTYYGFTPKFISDRILSNIIDEKKKF